MDGADVCGTSSRASRRPPNVTCGAAILDPRWRRRKWHQPGLGASFSIPIEGEVQNGDPSASSGHLGWPHLRNRKWGHPRWPPEAEGPPFCTSPSMGIEKLALYYYNDGDQVFPCHDDPYEIWIEFQMNNFRAKFSNWWVRYILWSYPHVVVTRPHCWLVDIRSGNGLVPSGNKSLHEPMLTQIAPTI